MTILQKNVTFSAIDRSLDRILRAGGTLPTKQLMVCVRVCNADLEHREKRKCFSPSPLMYRPLSAYSYGLCSVLMMLYDLYLPFILHPGVFEPHW